MMRIVIVLAAACAAVLLPCAGSAQATRMVTTLAGSATPGLNDGPALEAQFLVPSGLARAADGTLYVSDGAAQRIRRIAPDGSVRTVAGSGALGPVSQVLAIGDGQALFTDARNSNLRYLRLPRAGFDTSLYTRTIAGGELEKGILNAGFADGPSGSARFASPRGLALAGSSVIVADAGNHRLRSVALPAFRRSEAGLSDAYRYDAGHFEVAYISASNAFWDTIGDDSVCAHLERTIDAAHRTAKPARCHTVRIDAGLLPQLESYIKTALTFHHIDVLVVGADPLHAGAYPAVGTNAAGAPALHAAMAGLLQAIKPTEPAWS